jgi:hypothetical protein
VNIPVALKIRRGQVGERVGEISYKDMTGRVCGGYLTLLESVDGRLVLEEKINRLSLLCPGGGRLELEMVDETVRANWFGKKNPQKPKMSTELKRA